MYVTHSEIYVHNPLRNIIMYVTHSEIVLTHSETYGNRAKDDAGRIAHWVSAVSVSGY